MSLSPDSKLKQGFFKALGSPLKMVLKDGGMKDSTNLLPKKDKHRIMETQETPKNLLVGEDSARNLKLMANTSHEAKHHEIKDYASPPKKVGFFNFVAIDEEQKPSNSSPIKLNRYQSLPDQKGSSSPGKMSKSKMDDRKGFEILQSEDTIDEDPTPTKDFPSLSFGNPHENKFFNQDSIYDELKMSAKKREEEDTSPSHQFSIFKHLQKGIERKAIDEVVQEDIQEESPKAKHSRQKSSPQATLDNIQKSISSPSPSPSPSSFEISPQKLISGQGQQDLESPELPQVNIPLPSFGNNIPNEEQVVVFNAQANPTEPPQTAEDAALELDIKLYVARLMPVFITFGVISVLLLLMVQHKATYKDIFKVFYCYLFYLIAENIVRIRRYKRDHWKYIEDAFTALDAAAAIVFIYFVDLRITTGSEVIIHTSTPFTIISVSYIFISKAPDHVKTSKLLVQSLLIIQTLMISLQLTGYLNWDWNLIFGVLWAYLTVGAIYSSAFGIILSLLVLFLPLKYCGIAASTNFYKDCTGIIWHFLFYGLSLVCGLMLSGLITGYDLGEGFELLKLAAYVGLTVNLFLTLYTVLIYTTLIRYLKLFHSPTVDDEPNINYSGGARIKKPLDLQVEKKDSYFIKLSSTYFLPLQRGTFIKDQLGISRIKKLLKSMKVFKTKQGRLAAKNNNNTGLKRKNKPVELIVLKQYKDSLDQKFNNENKVEKVAAKKIGKAYTLKQLENDSPSHSPGKRSHLKFNATLLNFKLSDSHIKPQFSADDLSNFRTIVVGDETSRATEENLCYLCYTDAPNAVLLNCGHAGICYTCAVALVKKSGLCMECRGEVQAIYKIDPNPKLSDIIKGVELSTVNKNEPVNT